MHAAHPLVPTQHTLRSFAFLVGGVCILLWAHRTFVRGDRLVPLLFGALALFVLGVFVPSALARPYRVWMWAGERMGAVASRVLLTVFYLVVLTPIALVRRIAVRDPLELRWDPNASTYFHPKRIQNPKHLHRMF